MSRYVLLLVTIFAVLFTVQAQYYEVVDEDWTVMGVDYGEPLPYASSLKSAPIQTVKYAAPAKTQVMYSAPLTSKKAPVQTVYAVPKPLTYTTVQVPETHYETVYKAVPQTTYSLAPIVTIEKGGQGNGGQGNGGPGNGGQGNGGQGNGGMGGQGNGGMGGPGYGGMGGQGNGGMGGQGNGGMGGQGYGGQGNGGMGGPGYGGMGYGGFGGSGYGAKGGFGYGGYGGIGGPFAFGGPFGFGNPFNPFGTYYGFPLVTFLNGGFGGGQGGGHGGGHGGH